MGENAVVKADPMQEFQDRVKGKIREEIAGLIPDEALAKLAQQSLEEMFFKPIRVVVNRDWQGNPNKWEERPSWFHDAIIEATKPMMESAVKAAMEQYRDHIREQVAEAVKAERLHVFIAAAVAQETGQATAIAIGNVIQELRNRGQF